MTYDPSIHRASDLASRSIFNVKSALKDIQVLVLPLCEDCRTMETSEILESVHTLLRRKGLSSDILLKILLSTNGSVTRILDCVQPSQKDHVSVKTLNQVIIGLPADNVDSKIMRLLDLPGGALFNFRKVFLYAREKEYLMAISLTPLCALEKSFQDDLLRADTPIGSLLDRHGLEMLRQILRIDVVDGVNLFTNKKKMDVPFRIYKIIHSGETLMLIIEFFNPEEIRRL